MTKTLTAVFVSLAFVAAAAFATSSPADTSCCAKGVKKAACCSTCPGCQVSCEACCGDDCPSCCVSGGCAKKAS